MENFEKTFSRIQNMLCWNIPEERIVGMLSEEGFYKDEIFLALVAAKMEMERKE